MNVCLNLNVLPQVDGSSFRRFLPGEKHINRVFGLSVLLLVFDGVLRFTEDGVDVEVAQGEYYIQKAGLHQEGKPVCDSPYYYYIHFTGDYTPSPCSLPLRGSFSCKGMLEDVQRMEQLEADAASSLTEKTMVFYQILNSLAASQKQQTGKGELARRILNDITENYSRPLDLETLCARLFFSRNYIIRTFCEVYHMTPHAYLVAYRLKKAEQMMVSSTMTIEEISVACGFGDYSVFFKSFIKQYGMSPSKWRDRVTHR